MLPEVSSTGNALSLKDALTLLGALHQLARLSMGIIFWALWPQEKLPDDQAELARCLQEARRCIRTWKILACQEGARQAWAMLLTHFPTLEMKDIALVRPKDDDGKEIKADAMVERVIL
jgi:hypothetical protein